MRRWQGQPTPDLTGKEQEDEIQQTLRGPGSSMSGALAAGHEPGIGCHLQRAARGGTLAGREFRVGE